MAHGVACPYDSMTGFTVGMAAAEIGNNLGNSLWDYIDQQRTKSTVFHNFLYLDDDSRTIDSVSYILTLHHR